MPIKAINTSEPILGYTLKERIGSGGYGEVWVAEAPGGLAKAIKFVYGYHDENRAQVELKALNRIKEVRHPFLLSLERIDVVDGQLVVITELADMSLKDRFEQCLESGLKGIPRTELLGYLRDAADALDYISEEHRLQHLDVKPENLLLVSGHVKVADYGLVKDIHDGTQSLMGGLTPAFAPPELFDGRPSKSSDQYSLAIVFQEMLTGERPFDGVTAAQLAAQHMKERPRLVGLPRDDQAVIARALSKDPELRYANCRTLLSILCDRAERSPTTRRKTVKPKNRRGVRGDNTRDATLQLPEGTHPLAMRPAEIEKLPPPDVDAADAKARPTLFLGIGHTGTYILRQVRRRLKDRLGDAEAIPSMRILCLDTDRRDLAAATRGGTRDVLDDVETFTLPLRRSEDYRSDSRMHLSWLSRRWIYNVPRSLQTEGIRPLGRLAFADHHQKLYIRLRQLLSDLTRPESLAITAESLGMDPCEQPRVYIVGSIAGGACSGMAIDVAYAVRTILQELDESDDDVVGLFTHSAGRGGAERELAVANTLAFLGELYHFSCVEDYPGDETCELPPFEDGGPTFGHSYLVHMGEEIGQRGFDQATDSIAEFLYLSAATPCAAFFDRCRTEEPESRGLGLRTFGLSRSGGVSGDIVDRSAHLLCRHLLDKWIARRSAQDEPNMDANAGRLFSELGLTPQGMVKRIHDVVLSHEADPAGSLAKNLLGQFDARLPEQSLTRIRDSVDQFLGRSAPSGQPGLEHRVEQMVRNFPSEPGHLGNRVLAVVDDPQLRYPGAHALLQTIRQHLQEQQLQIESLRSQALDRLRQWEVDFIATEAVDDAAARLQSYAELHLQLFTLDAVLRLYSSLASQLETTHQELEVVHGRLLSIAARHAPDVESSQEDEGDHEDEPAVASRIAKLLLGKLETRLAKLVDRVDHYLSHGVLDANGGMRRVLADEKLFASLNGRLVDAARATVIDELKEVNFDDFLTDERGEERKELVEWLYESAQPRLLRCGGSTRLLLAVPARSTAKRLADEVRGQYGQQPCVMASTIGELAVCLEAEQVPLTNVTMTLLQNRPDSIEYASRLHTRTDVPWCSLTAIR